MSAPEGAEKKEKAPGKGGEKKPRLREAYTSFGQPIKVHYGPEDLDEIKEILSSISQEQQGMQEREARSEINRGDDLAVSLRRVCR